MAVRAKTVEPKISIQSLNLPESCFSPDSDEKKMENSPIKNQIIS